MFALHVDGKFDRKIPGDLKREPEGRTWSCTKCRDLFLTKSEHLIHIASEDIIYHRHNDGKLYPCIEFTGFNDEGNALWLDCLPDELWARPLCIKGKEIVIPLNTPLPSTIIL